MYTALVVDDEQELRQAIIESVDWEKAGFRVVGDAETESTRSSSRKSSSPTLSSQT